MFKINDKEYRNKYEQIAYILTNEYDFKTKLKMLIQIPDIDISQYIPYLIEKENNKNLDFKKEVEMLLKLRCINIKYCIEYLIRKENNNELQ